uniref:Choline transporter-like protein n=1 Tax=Spongospora subterranea TaxID=70186 RepID=A0A0H5RL53_9EUKA|eukprot:CRZ09449.1 hypothetical protein [Spongospora subterranea]
MDQQHAGHVHSGYNALDDDRHCNYATSVPYRDPAFAVVFILQLIGVISVAIIFAPGLYNNANPNHHRDYEFQWEIVTSVGIGLLSSLVFAALWIKILQRHADQIIYLSVMSNIGVQAAIGIYALCVNLPMLSLLMFVSAGVAGIIYYFARNRVKFASVMLELSVAALNHNPAVIWLTLLGQVLAICWLCVWSTAVVALLVQTMDSSHSQANGALPGFAVFCLILSFIWTLEVLQNIFRTIASGVCGTFYFFGFTRNPTFKAARRTLTTSFGSICLGGLIVSVIEALRVIFKSSRRGNRDSIADACCTCILSCIESIVKYISKYAYARVAVYGESFMQASRATYDLFKTKGIDVVVADELSSIAVFSGAILGGAVAGFCGSLSVLVLTKDASLAFAVGCFGFIVSIGVVAMMMSILSSGVATFLVLWAEEPRALQQNHPQLHAKLAAAVRSQFPTVQHSQI